MTRFSRSVFSHSARLFLSVTSFARPVLQTSLRRLARIEDHVLEYCARRQTRRGPERPLDLAPLRSAAQETAAHLTPARPRRGSGLRKLAARTLGIGITTVILLGLIGVQETRAQVITTTALYSPGGTIAVGNLSLSTSDCSNHRDRPTDMSAPGYAVANALYVYCEGVMDELLLTPLGLWLLPAPGIPGAGGWRIETAPEATPQADPAFTSSLTSSVASLPFLGNWLVGASFVLNASTPASATAGYKVALRRQSNCSLDEDLILPGGTMPEAEYITSLTGAQDYYHELAGLTTTPDVFANSCNYQVLGLPATGSVLLLGNTSDGAAISAELASNGLYVSVTDLTANTTTNTQLSSGSNPGYFSAASLRNNGIYDLVETGLTDPVTSAAATAVFLGNGDGTFKPPIYYDVADTSGAVAGFTIDDVTGDGIPDIVIPVSTSVTNNGVPTFTGTVTTLIGKGDGTFTTGPVSNATWTTSLLPVTGIFKTGDVKDLLIGGTVLFGSGNGSFTVGQTNTAIASATSSLFPGAVGSLRNNGKLDVVVTQPGFVSIYYGNGDGTFTTGPSYAALPDYMQVTITDVDGDGNPDIVMGTGAGGIFTDGTTDVEIPSFQILMGLGNGTFVDSPVYNQGTYAVQGNANNTQLEIASGNFISGNSNLDVLVFDQNNNGGSPSSLLMLPGNGTGALGAPVTSSINIGPYFLVAAKMNHDTLPDAVLAGYSLSASPQLSVLVNQGNGTFAGEKDYALPDAPVSLAVGDFNGDGIPDVAVGMSGGVDVLFGQANGTLGTPVLVDSSANPTGLAAGSLTTDGRTDLVVADEATGTLHVYLGNANGTFTTVTAPTTTATNYTVAALGDLNNDGKLDLIVAGTIPGTIAGLNTNNVYTFLGNGDGTFKAANTLALTGQDGIGATSIELADINNRGNLGVVIGNPADYTEVLIGNGDGTLVDTALALGQRPATVAAADLLGNGYPEILVGETGATSSLGSLTVFQNMPSAWTTAATTTTPTVTVTPSPTSITTAQSTMVTITVSGDAATPTGSVTLTSGTYTSAATALTSGSAVITVPGSSLAVATDTLTATYTPDSTSSPSTAPQSERIRSPSPPRLRQRSRSRTTVPSPLKPAQPPATRPSITVTPANGFTGAVNLTCAVTTTPANATSPATCAVTLPRSPSVALPAERHAHCDHHNDDDTLEPTRSPSPARQAQS